MDISLKLNDRFYQLIAFGLGVTYIFQVFLTVGGGCKFIPLTGVTLPLISYGGSSVLTTLIMFAIVEGLCMVKIDEEKESQQAAKRLQRRRLKIQRKAGRAGTDDMEMEEGQYRKIRNRKTRNRRSPNRRIWNGNIQDENGRHGNRDGKGKAKNREREKTEKK